MKNRKNEEAPKRRDDSYWLTPEGTEELADQPYGRWSTIPGVIKVISEPTPEQKKLAEEINAIMARKAQMDEIISRLPEREQELLNMRYVRRMHISLEIPRKVHASKRTVHYWMSAAIEKIALFCTKFGVQ